MSQNTAKVYAITGGASGIGLATAKLLSERGNIVCVADISPDSLNDAATYFEAAKATFTTTQVDVSSREQEKDHGVKPVAELDDEEWHKIMAVNLTGLMYCLRKELQTIEDKGSIVNIASIHGTVGLPLHGAYAASKHGMIGLTKAAAKENGKREVRVNAIAPGSIYTPMMQGWWDANGRSDHAGFSEPSAFQRLGTPEEVAKLIAFLLGPDSTFISGSVYSIDGAWL